MKRSCAAAAILLALAAACQAAAPAKDHKMAMLSISPPLKDVASDKKFFGPPFPADYPDDKRPKVIKSIMDSIRGPNEPYPALQAAKDYDADYVKDENSDTGAWKAQFEYDAARKRLLDEEGDEKRAQDSADQAGKELDDAQKNADGADKSADDAEKAVEDAKHAQDDSGKDTGDSGDQGSVHDQEKLADLKKQVADAESAYEAQKKAFAECERQLKEAEANYEKLKAELAEMEKKAYGAAKLWAEQKTVRMAALKAKKDAEKAAAQAKTKAAGDVLTKVQAAKAEADKKLAKEKAEHVAALRRLAKEKADLVHASEGLEDARMRLQALRGHAPPSGLKSGSYTTSVVSLLLLAALRAIL